MAYDEEGFLEKARLADESNCDIIEIRADSMAMGGYREPEKIKKIVERIKTVTEKPLILTIRSMEEGGMANIDRTSYYMLIRDIIEIFDLEKIKPEVLDIEAFDKDYGARSDMMEFMVNLAHDAGMKVIVSNHDVEKTPKIGEMVERIMIMDKFGADIPKGAYMALSEGDVNNVMEAVKVVAQKIKKPYILISMGEESASDMRTAHTCGDHYGTENRQKAAGKVLGAVYEAREYLSRKPSGDDDAQDVSGGRV